MKKLFSLLTALICAVSLTAPAFAAQPDAFSLYQKYLELSKDITSMNLTMVQKVSMVNDGEELEVSKQNIGAKIIIPSDGKVEMEMRAYDTATKQLATSYFRNDYLYQQIGDEKYKIKMEMNEALAGVLGTAPDIDEKMVEDVLKNAKFDIVDDGIRISYTIKASELDNSLASMPGDIQLPQDVKLSFSDMAISMTIGYDGVLKSYSNTCGVSIGEGDVNISLKISQNVKVNSINDVERIYFPADLGAYKLLQ